MVVALGRSFHELAGGATAAAAAGVRLLVVVVLLLRGGAGPEGVAVGRKNMKYNIKLINANRIAEALEKASSSTESAVIDDIAIYCSWKCKLGEEIDR